MRCTWTRAIEPQAQAKARVSVAQVGEKRLADVAQLVEHSLGKGEVISSILIIGSRHCRAGFKGRERAGFRGAAETRQSRRLSP